MVTSHVLVDMLDLNPSMRFAAGEIYESAFPAAVRAPFQDLVAVRDGEMTMVLVDGEDVLGLALVRSLGGARVVFLRYFVVAADRRGSGVGGELWHALSTRLVADGCELLAFDVEDPDDPHASPAEHDERVRRVRFYERLGAVLLPVVGYAPPEHGTPGLPAPPLRLMAAQLDERPRAPTGEALGDLVRAVYEHRYGLPEQATVVRDTLRRSGLR